MGALNLSLSNTKICTSRGCAIFKIGASHDSYGGAIEYPLGMMKPAKPMWVSVRKMCAQNMIWVMLYSIKMTMYWTLGSPPHSGPLAH